MNSIKFEHVLKSVNYPINNEIKDGRIEDARFDHKSLSLFFTVCFPSVISPNALIDLNYALRDGLVRNGIGKNVEFSYKFDNSEMSSALLEDYYQTVLEKLIEKRIRFKALNKFKTSYENNKVLLYLGNINEVKFVKPLIDDLYKSFCTLGLDFIDMDVEVSEFVQSIDAETNVSREVSIKEYLPQHQVDEL